MRDENLTNPYEKIEDEPDEIMSDRFAVRDKPFTYPKESVVPGSGKMEPGYTANRTSIKKRIKIPK